MRFVGVFIIFLFSVCPPVAAEGGAPEREADHARASLDSKSVQYAPLTLNGGDCNVAISF